MVEDKPTLAREGATSIAPDEVIAWEHSARTLTGLRLTAFGGAACAVLLQLVRHKTAFHWIITAMLVVLAGTAGAFAIWARGGRLVPPAVRFLMGVMISTTALMAIAFLGVISSTTLILCSVVYAYATTDWPLEAWATYAVCSLGYALVAGLSFAGVLPLTGSVLALQKENVRALVGLTLLAEMVFALTFWFARRGRKATLAAIQYVAEARVEVEKRRALLAEAREDLRQVVDAGRLGRLSGQTFDEYAVGEVIGRGAMGEVYAATRTASGDPAAIKVLHPHLVDRAEDVQRFQREMKITATIHSRNVVELFGTGTAPDGSPYLAMEWLSGQDLAALLRGEGRLSLSDCVTLVREVAVALDAAREAGIVHRDVKPHNLFRVEADSGTHWKVLDFGVSRFVDLESSLTQGAVGTPSYMSPEQCRGRPVDHRADVFALSAVVYRALTGRPAFSADDHYTIIYRIVNEQPVKPSDLAMIPSDVDLVLALGLAKDPETRFATALEFATAFEQATHNALPTELRERARSVLQSAAWSIPT